jgi:hypothetical protein
MPGVTGNKEEKKSYVPWFLVPASQTNGIKQSKKKKVFDEETKLKMLLSSKQTAHRSAIVMTGACVPRLNDGDTQSLNSN